MTRRLFGQRIGATHDLIHVAGDPYLERWILWLGPLGSLRVHRFWRGDSDRALHDHPWPFVTFPLQAYTEQWWHSEHRAPAMRLVRAFRFHLRRSTHRHIVKLLTVPTWTIVWTGPKVRKWGFYPGPDRFVPWREWADVSHETEERD